jgi:hypothetical protein
MVSEMLNLTVSGQDKQGLICIMTCTTVRVAGLPDGLFGWFFFLS